MTYTLSHSHGHNLPVLLSSLYGIVIEQFIHVLLKRNIKMWTHKQYPYLAFIHDPLTSYFFKYATLQ